MTTSQQAIFDGITDATMLRNKHYENGYTVDEYIRIKEKYESCLNTIFCNQIGSPESVEYELKYAEFYTDAFDATAVSDPRWKEIEDYMENLDD